MADRVIVVETDRLRLRRLCPEDAGFVLELVNDPDWLRFIGDRGVRTLEDASDYIRSGPMEMYERLGFGLFAVERKDGNDSIGICGLLKRDQLEEVDIGFAFLPAFRRQGFAREAASGVLKYARGILELGRIAAITSLDNEASQRLLRQLGFRSERTLRLSADGPELRLFIQTPEDGDDKEVGSYDHRSPLDPV